MKRIYQQANQLISIAFSDDYKLTWVAGSKCTYGIFSKDILKSIWVQFGIFVSVTCSVPTVC